MNTHLAIIEARARFQLFLACERAAGSADYRAGYRADRMRMGRLLMRLIQRAG